MSQEIKSINEILWFWLILAHKSVFSKNPQSNYPFTSPGCKLIIISNYSDSAPRQRLRRISAWRLASPPKTPSGKWFEVLQMSRPQNQYANRLSVHANRLPNINLFAYNVNWCCCYNSRINSSNWLLSQLKGNLHTTSELKHFRCWRLRAAWRRRS